MKTTHKILSWLKGKGIPLGGLTSHDVAALCAATEIAELWIRGDTERRRLSATAFNCVVSQMQPEVQYMAFHAIAMVSDWCYRMELWSQSGLSRISLDHIPECRFAPPR